MKKKLTFDDICKWFEENGLECVGMDMGNDRVYVDKDRYIEIHISESIPSDQMTPEDEDRIRERLVELGYL